MLRSLLFGIGALIVAGVVVILYAGHRPTQTTAAVEPPTMTSIIVTARPVRAGSLLQPADLAAKSINAASVPPGAQPDTPDARGALVGAMVRRMLDQQEPIVSDTVLRPGDRGFLAAVLNPGMRAVSVAVDSVTGAAGLIWPGDRVDLILTQTIEAANRSLARRVAGEIVLSNVQVIAVDQQLVQGGQAGGLLDTHTPASRTITLQVSPDDASRIAVASRLGRLQVALRAAASDPVTTDADQQSAAPVADIPHLPPAVSTNATTEAVTPADPKTLWAGDVSHALAAPASSQSRELHLYQGGKPGEVYKF